MSNINNNLHNYNDLSLDITSWAVYICIVPGRYSHLKMAICISVVATFEMKKGGVIHLSSLFVVALVGKWINRRPGTSELYRFESCRGYYLL